jgi:hypothetical protein
MKELSLHENTPLNSYQGMSLLIVEAQDVLFFTFLSWADMEMCRRIEFH